MESEPERASDPRTAYMVHGNRRCENSRNNYLDRLAVQLLSECLVAKYLGEDAEVRGKCLTHLDFVLVTFVPLHLPNHHLPHRATVNFRLTRFELD